MSPASPSSTILIDAITRFKTTPAKPSTERLPANNDDGLSLQRNPRTVLTRHYTSLQEHADNLRGVDAAAEDSGLTPRHESRREGFSWGLPSALEDQQRRPSLDPLPPGHLEDSTPPSLDEIMRKSINSETNGSQEPSFQHIDTAESQLSAIHPSRSSTMSEALSRTDTRRSSIAAFARGLARHVPDIRMFSPPEKTFEGKQEVRRRDSQDAAYVGDSKRHRKPSLTFSLPINSYKMDRDGQKPPSVLEQPVSEPTIPQEIQASVKGSLRDRRKVKLDLSLPTEIVEIPLRSRSPAGAMSSITPSRPRSPKTPWIRDEPYAWELAKLPKSAPIMEEGHIQSDLMDEGSDGHLNRLQKHTLCSPQPTELERKSLLKHDHRHLSRPAYKRNRSGPSTIKVGNAVQTEDSWKPREPSIVREQQQCSPEKNPEPDRTIFKSRIHRWRRRLSSEDALQSLETPLGRFSINPFKRAKRGPCRLERNEIEAPASPSRFLRGKQAIDTATATSSLANMPVPPAFVPPGVNRVPTPPMFDAHGEVKGKLADFFFDVHGEFGATKRKEKASPGGYWDSDALLMSLSTEIHAEDDEDEEGPEGRPVNAYRQADFNVNGTPGLVSSPAGNAGIKGEHSVAGMPSPMLGQDSWLHLQHGEDSDEYVLAANSLNFEEERRKFEWLVPEHLPTSPLCPLHAKYRGPSQGTCYWHSDMKPSNTTEISNENTGQEAHNSVVGTNHGPSKYNEGQSRVRTGNRGWEVGKFDLPAKDQEVKKRRLVSLSSP